MTRNEQMLVGRINQLTMMVFLQEMRARVLQQQVIDANRVIATDADTIKHFMGAVFGGEVHPTTIDGIC